MSEAYEPTVIDETTRIAYYYDNHATSPTEWWDSDTLSIHSLYTDRNYPVLQFGKDPDGETLDKIWENKDRYEKEEAISRHFARANRAHYVSSDEQGIAVWYMTATNSNINWTDSLMEYVKEYEAYLRGKVYMVALEKRVTYRNDADPTDVRYEWVGDDVVCGLTCNSAESLEYEAREYFGLHTDLKKPVYSSESKE
jgi:hypothetical protein